MSRTPTPTVLAARTAAGYLTPAAVVARYGARYGFGIKWVYALVRRWKTEGRTRGRVPALIMDSNAWLLGTAVEAVLKERSGR